MAAGALALFATVLATATHRAPMDLTYTLVRRRPAFALVGLLHRRSPSRYALAAVGFTLLLTARSRPYLGVLAEARRANVARARARRPRLGVSWDDNTCSTTAAFKSPPARQSRDAGRGPISGHGRGLARRNRLLRRERPASMPSAWFATARRVCVRFPGVRGHNTHRG